MVLEPSKEERNRGREVQEDLFSDAGFDGIRLPRRPEEVDRLRKDGKEKDDKIERLNREIGKWQAMYEMLKEQTDEDEDEDD